MGGSAQQQLVKLREGIITRFLMRQIKARHAASLLGIHPKSFSRLSARYQKRGWSVLVPKKPGPKKGRVTPANRTPTHVVKSVLKLSRDNSKLSPRQLVLVLRRQGGGFRIPHPSTVWRILRRQKKAK